ncbi:hypothetical protein TSOC_008709 [Tetrabaena socialis]|uniref:Uncharacterized protein n=1 Tax=Tetrabaena socialis TaxID=47790 RepID=A0A2J7ZXU1_9CHLO|nr:hypothetical protein TSOC_008709 [Tetrabaena socialis]|eukprot:PNH05075.1 hypothetical protein TSOC_008709 [Tetrabaena socialis]
MEPELLLLKRSFERLDRQYRSADEKLSEFRERLRETRLELAQKDRQLEAAKKLLAAAGQERHEQQIAAEQSRDLSRRLGAKLSLQGPELPELAAKLGRSKRKVVELTAQLHEAQTRLLLSEEAGRQQSAEVLVLKKALGLRSELALPGLAGFDGQAQLLHSLARSQEEGASLAVQLAEGSRHASSLEDQVCVDQRDLAFDCGVPLSLDFQMLGLVWADAAVQVGYLQGEVERAVGGRVAAEEAAGAARRDTGEALGRAAALQLDIDELQAQLRRTSTHLDEVALARRAAEERGDAAAARSRQLAEQLVAEERAGRAQSSLAAARAEVDGYCERSEEAAAQMDSERRLRMQVQSQLENSSQRGAVREEQLAAEAARLRGEGAALALANERLSGEVKQAREALSGAAARQSASERHIEELHAAVTSLTRSKTKLQSTMLEQLSLFKSKLQQVEADNTALRGALLTAASPGSAAAGAGFGGSPSLGARDYQKHHQYRGSPGGGAASSAAGASLGPGGGGSYRGGGSPGGMGYGSPLAAYDGGSALSEERGGRGLRGRYDDE